MKYWKRLLLFCLLIGLLMLSSCGTNAMHSASGSSLQEETESSTGGEESSESSDTPSSADTSDESGKDAESDEIDSGNESEGEQEDEDSICEHRFGVWEMVKAATCNAEGQLERVCRDCSIAETAILPKTDAHTEVIDAAVPATCTKSGLTEGRHCAVCLVILLAQQPIAAAHTAGKWITEKEATETEDGKRRQICAVCNETVNVEPIPATGTADLSFSFENGTYTVDRYRGREWEIYIPAQFNDGTNGYAPVTAIAPFAFANTDIETVVIPSTVERIGDGAFKGCYFLISVTLSEGLLYIGAEAFFSSHLLESVVIPSTVLEIGDYAFRESGTVTLDVRSPQVKMGAWVFYSCDRLATVSLAAGTTEIFHGAFENCISLTRFSLPDGVTTLHADAFMSCENLMTVMIPHSVTSIGDWAFYECSFDLTVRYQGTKEEWKQIAIGSHNDVLYQCTVIYEG